MVPGFIFEVLIDIWKYIFYVVFLLIFIDIVLIVVWNHPEFDIDGWQ